jgi:hypothetical protein
MIRRGLAFSEKVSVEHALALISTGLVVMVHVSSRWRNSLKGLCGTHDGNSMNDLTMPDGSISVSSTEFGNSWKEAGVTCSDIPEAEIVPDPCTVRQTMFR